MADEAHDVNRRIVLERVPVNVDGDDSIQFAWVERGEFTGSKTGAIEQYAGKPGTPDAKTGEWKAVPARSWAGGIRHTQPALPKIEREFLQ